MSDVFDVAKRSQVMARIRGRGNKSTEQAMAKLLRREKIWGWRRHVALKVPVKTGRAGKRAPSRMKITPDFVFRELRLVLFVDGCFWHGCPLHGTSPQANREFWAGKLAGNVARDKQTRRGLEALGWSVLRVWEHEFRDEARLTAKLRKRLNAASRARP